MGKGPAGSIKECRCRDGCRHLALTTLYEFRSKVIILLLGQWHGNSIRHLLLDTLELGLVDDGGRRRKRGRSDEVLKGSLGTALK